MQAFLKSWKCPLISLNLVMSITSSFLNIFCSFWRKQFPYGLLRAENIRSARCSGRKANFLSLLVLARKSQCSQRPFYARDILCRALGLNRYESLRLWTALPKRFQSHDVSLPERWTRNWILDNPRDRLRTGVFSLKTKFS